MSYSKRSSCDLPEKLEVKNMVLLDKRGETFNGGIFLVIIDSLLISLLHKRMLPRQGLNKQNMTHKSRHKIQEMYHEMRNGSLR